MSTIIQEHSYSVNWCMNCVGWHPDELPSMMDAVKKMSSPQKDAWAQQLAFKSKKLTVYANKSCALCGRTYKPDGELDVSWKETAHRVKMELDNAGVYGVDDKKVDLIVVKCRKAVEFLFENRLRLLNLAIEENKKGNPNALMNIQKWTFSGHLAFIITHAQEARKSRLGLHPSNIKGATT